MKEDPAIDEIRAVRHRISERFGHDTKALMDHYRKLERKYSNRLLRGPVGSALAAPGPTKGGSPTTS